MYGFDQCFGLMASWTHGLGGELGRHALEFQD